MEDFGELMKTEGDDIFATNPFSNLSSAFCSDFDIFQEASGEAFSEDSSTSGSSLREESQELDLNFLDADSLLDSLKADVESVEDIEEQEEAPTAATEEECAEADPLSIVDLTEAAETAPEEVTSEQEAGRARLARLARFAESVPTFKTVPATFKAEVQVPLTPDERKPNWDKPAAMPEWERPVAREPIATFVWKGEEGGLERRPRYRLPSLNVEEKKFLASLCVPVSMGDCSSSTTEDCILGDSFSSMGDSSMGDSFYSMGDCSSMAEESYSDSDHSYCTSPRRQTAPRPASSTIRVRGARHVLSLLKPAGRLQRTVQWGEARTYRPPPATAASRPGLPRPLGQGAAATRNPAATSLLRTNWGTEAKDKKNRQERERRTMVASSVGRLRGVLPLVEDPRKVATKTVLDAARVYSSHLKDKERKLQHLRRQEEARRHLLRSKLTNLSTNISSSSTANTSSNTSSNLSSNLSSNTSSSSSVNTSFNLSSNTSFSSTADTSSTASQVFATNPRRYCQ